MLDPDRYFTTADVAAYLGLKPNTVEQLRKRGGGPVFIHIGRLVRYRGSDVLAWIESRTVRPGKEA